jgi:hypothetical protein
MPGKKRGGCALFQNLGWTKVAPLLLPPPAPYSGGFDSRPSSTVHGAWLVTSVVLNCSLVKWGNNGVVVRIHG